MKNKNNTTLLIKMHCDGLALESNNQKKPMVKKLKKESY